MPHASFDANCRMCTRLAASSEPVFENELWHVRPIDPPSGVPGWMMLVARRHVAGPAQFDAREIQSFGPTWCHLQRVLLEVTGALRIYTAAYGRKLAAFFTATWCRASRRCPTTPRVGRCSISSARQSR